MPTLFKLASDAPAAGDEPAVALGRSLSTTVQRLSELRNTAGAGHGHASLRDVSENAARLAASAACGVATFLLSGPEAGGA